MAGARDPQELVVGGSGDLYYAPLGTALPADADAALNAAFYKAGYISEDGLSLNVAISVNDLKVWQEKAPVRREIEDRTQSLTAALGQWNAETIRAAYGGGTTVKTGTSQWTYTFPAADEALLEVAVVAEVVDVDMKHRIVFARASITEPVQTTFSKSALSLLPVTLSALPPAAGGSGVQYHFSGSDFGS